MPCRPYQEDPHQVSAASRQDDFEELKLSICMSFEWQTSCTENKAIGSRPAAGSSRPSPPGQEVAGAHLPCGVESWQGKFLGSLLHPCGRVPRSRRQVE